MQPTYSQTGGGLATQDPQTKIVGPNESIGATWPLAKLTFYKDKIDLKLNSTNYTFELSEIESVHRVIAFPVIGDGLQIIHHGKAPKIVVFWSILRQKRLLKEFSRLGVPVTKTSWGNPGLGRKA